MAELGMDGLLTGQPKGGGVSRNNGGGGERGVTSSLARTRLPAG